MTRYRYRDICHICGVVWYTDNPMVADQLYNYGCEACQKEAKASAERVLRSDGGWNDSEWQELMEHLKQGPGKAEQ